ncbi:uncharacterized protein ACWYII_008947 [Salvelinus alpinus]
MEVSGLVGPLEFCCMRCWLDSLPSMVKTRMSCFSPSWSTTSPTPKSMSKEAVAICKGLMTKHPGSVWAVVRRGERDIRDHGFFRYMDWDKVEKQGSTTSIQTQSLRARGREL